MSNIVIVELVFDSLECLDAAAKRRGLEFRRNQETFRWYGEFEYEYEGENAAQRHGISVEDFGKCDHAIGVPGDSQAYEIGVVKNPDGPGYRLVYDFWDQDRLVELAGENCEELVQAYGIESAKAKTLSMGLSTLSETVLESGEVKLSFARY